MLQAFTMFNFVWNFALPVAIFACCYLRIFYVIRRHGKVVSGHVGHNQGVAMEAIPGEQIQQHASGADTGSALSRAELNVLQTMIIIIVCFVICWAPVSLAQFVLSLMVCIRGNNVYLLAF